MTRAKTADSSKLTYAMEQIAFQTNRAGEIIKHIRSLVSKREPQRYSLDVNDVIREVVNMEKAEAGQRGVSIKTKLGKSMPLILADKIEVEQVILNLVRNGFEAMSDTEVGRRKITIQTSRVGSDSIQVAVRDTGKGLSPEDPEKVFDSFFTTKPDGLGIGLSLSRSIIEAHGGRLWAESNPDCGASFLFTLPVKGV